MRVQSNFSALVILSVLLQSCGGGGGGGSSNVVPPPIGGYQAPDGAKMYNILGGSTKYFEGPLEMSVFFAGKKTNTSLVKEKYPGESQKDSIYVVLESGDNITVDKAGVKFDESINLLSVSSSNNVFDIQGTSDSKFKINQFLYLKAGTVKTSEAKLVLNTTWIQKDGILESTKLDDITFEKSDKKNIVDGKDISNLLIVDGNYKANLIVPTGFTLAGAGVITGNVVNNGTVSLSSGKTLTMGDFNTSSGSLDVTLGVFTSIPLLKTQKAILGTATLNLTLKTSASGKYTLIGGTGISGHLSLTLKSEGRATCKADGNDYIIDVTSGGTLASKAPRFSSHMFSKARNMGTSFASSHLQSLQTGFSLMHSAKTFGIGNGLSFTAHQEAEANFFALTAKNLGLFAGYSRGQNIEGGAYSLHAFGDFSLSNLVHFGKTQSGMTGGEVRNTFFQAQTQLRRSFDMGSFKLSPKLMAGFSSLLELDGFLNEEENFHLEAGSRGSFMKGMGVDLVSKSTSFETFVSFDLVHSSGHDLSLVTEDNERFGSSGSGLTASLALGFKASIDSGSKLYGSLKMDSNEDHKLEMGLNLKF
jgi:hypothetical protein